MKKILFLLTAMIVCFSSVASAEEAIRPIKVGVLVSDSGTQWFYDHADLSYLTDSKEYDTSNIELIVFNDAASMILALKSGRVEYVMEPLSAASYVLDHNEEITANTLVQDQIDVSYSMVVTQDNHLLCKQLNNAILSMKEDGTLDKIVEHDLTPYITNGEDPLPEKLPSSDKAPTVRVALTGDLPPMDYVTADGQPAGFNVALLTEISYRTGINFEPVLMSSAAKTAALLTGQVDLFFWADSIQCVTHDVEYDLSYNHCLLTEPYYTDRQALISLSETA